MVEDVIENFEAPKITKKGQIKKGVSAMTDKIKAIPKNAKSAAKKIGDGISKKKNKVKEKVSKVSRAITSKLSR